MHHHIPGQYGKPVDRTNSLIIHPTYYRMTDPNYPRPPLSQFSSSEIMLRDYVANLRKPPPPYRLGSSSTPDLASQNAVLNLSSNPELMSKYQLGSSNHNLMSQFDQSVENLALDTQRLQLNQQIASKSKQQLAEEQQSSSEQLVAFTAGPIYNQQQHVIIQNQESQNNPQLIVQTSENNLNQNYGATAGGGDSNMNQGQSGYAMGNMQRPKSFLHQSTEGVLPEEQEVFITDPPNLQASHSPPHFHSVLAATAQYSHTPNQMFYTPTGGNTGIDIIGQTPLQQQQQQHKKEHIYQNLPPKTSNSQLGGYGNENPYENLPPALIDAGDGVTKNMDKKVNDTKPDGQEIQKFPKLNGDFVSTHSYSQSSSSDATTYQESSMTSALDVKSILLPQSSTSMSPDHNHGNIQVSSAKDKEHHSVSSRESGVVKQVSSQGREALMSMSTLVPVPDDVLEEEHLGGDPTSNDKVIILC